MSIALTLPSLSALIERLENRDGHIGRSALIELILVSRTGKPADAKRAKNLGADYICALEDGRIVAWGEDYLRRYGHGGDTRRIVVL